VSPSHISYVVFLQTASVPIAKDLGVLQNTELQFHNPVDRIAAEALHALERIRYITSSSRTSESLLLV
jgi:hypothetical protein